jgi:hypothetical protein
MAWITTIPETSSDGELRDDRGIHDTAAIVGYFNFVNRLAEGLGVALET